MGGGGATSMGELLGIFSEGVGNFSKGELLGNFSEGMGNFEDFYTGLGPLWPRLAGENRHKF
jgi:hypothetical protein